MLVSTQELLNLIGSSVTHIDQCWKQNKTIHIFGRELPRGQARPAIFLNTHGKVVGAQEAIWNLCENKWCINPDHMEVIHMKIYKHRRAERRENAAAQ